MTEMYFDKHKRLTNYARVSMARAKTVVKTERN